MPKRLKPKRILSSLKSYHASHANDLDYLKNLYDDVVARMGPHCPHEPFKEDLPSLASAMPDRVDAAVQATSDDVLSASGTSDGVTVLDSSSDDDSTLSADRKEDVLIESLMMKSVLHSIKKESKEEGFHVVTMDNLPPKITQRDVERDVFDLVGIDKTTLAVNIKRNGTESFMQIYTNDNRQVQKILACDKKVVVGGRVMGARLGLAGGP